MTNILLQYLCDPETKESLELIDPVYDGDDTILSGGLRNSAGHVYPIVNGIPRFVVSDLNDTVTSFGDQWNFFNFNLFRLNWLNHTVRNTFGSQKVFEDKIVVDAGGGSGMQTMWMLESGARHVILLDLSHSVDDVVQRNLRPSGFKNYDVIQCSIDTLPLKPNSIEGIIICHNVIQHTPSVEKTAKELFSVVSEGSEFVFNCYRKNCTTLIKKIIFECHSSIRGFLKTKSFTFRLFYARMLGLVRFVPLLGWLLEKTNICIRGDVPRGADAYFAYIRRCYKATVLNTFDHFGAHEFQHFLTDNELQEILGGLQPDRSKILNYETYFDAKQPIGCALRVIK